ncbi:MAG: menaquinol-cytochrome c reductase cytochrome b/c subunit [Actinomycetota bacterium]|jgi:menaquinol-cytochrome c reductase cytochrome b/c subunit|nr:menaquinol-cytochrome c reductase cytochrome b/c subunit [Actinomycetota bacterium]
MPGEVPEHLLKRSAERRRALGLPVPGEEGGAPPEDAPEAPAAGAPADAPAAEAPAAAEGGAPEARPTGDPDSKIPAHLLARSAARRAAKEGGEAPAAGGAGAKAPAATGGRAAAATATAPPSTATGPGGHTQRLLTVVKAGSIQQTRAEAQDKVHVWPHLLVGEFVSLLSLMALVTIFSALVRAPLLEQANFNQTPNPSKAPWYFLGLQELLTIWHPMVAGVTIPGMGLIVLMMAPYIDKNPATKPSDRKFAICIFTLFLMFWAVLVIIGSFFRGPGFNFVYPWKVGTFFDL